MTAEWLLRDYAGAWTTDTGSAAFEISLNYVPGHDGGFTRLRWRRTDTTVGHKPVNLRVYDAATQQIVYSAPTIPDDGAVGWQVHTPAATIPVYNGRTYKVAFGWSALAGAGWTNTGIPASPPAPGAWANPRKSDAGSGNLTYPGSNPDNTFVYGVDAEYDPDFVPGPEPATPTDVANELAAWLSTTDGTHGDSAPLQDHATLATVDTNVAAVEAQQNEWAFGLGAAAHGYFGVIQGLIDTIKGETDQLPDFIAGTVDIMLDHYTADIAGILAQIDSVLSNLGAQSTDLSGTAGSAVGALSGRTGFPATGWTMSAEADFEDAIAFAEPADTYVLTITSYQDTQPANESPAGLWLPRLGWWCVLNGSLASQRQFVDFQQMILDDQGRRMPGCAIQLRPGTLATVQAWVLA